MSGVMPYLPCFLDVRGHAAPAPVDPVHLAVLGKGHDVLGVLQASMGSVDKHASLQDI